METRAKTAAERQRDYRARQREAGQKPSSYLIDDANTARIDAYAKQHGISKNEALNELLRKD